MWPKNPYEVDDAPPTCDVKWAAGCTNVGVLKDDGAPEIYCHPCHALCVRCQSGEWVGRVNGDRVCAQCQAEARGAA